MKYIDIHSHINLSPLWEDQENIIMSMRDARVSTVTVGVDFETSQRAIQLAEKYPDVCIGATVGQHPNDNPKECFELDAYVQLAQHKTVLAIGECGLDYFRLSGNYEEKEHEKARQIELFRAHVKLAIQTNLPLMIHARPSKESRSDTYIDVLNILEEEQFTGKVDFHFYVGDIDTTRKIIQKGYSMSFDGPITFSNEYDEIINEIPLSQIMCETDAPFAAPAPHRGKICKPWMVEEVIKKIAEIKKLPETKVSEQLLKNFEAYFT